MLATYSLGNNQDANHMALIALHVGNLQPGKHLRCPSYGPHGLACWQPSAWETPKMSIIWPMALIALHVGNLQPGKQPRCQSYGSHSPECWQPIGRNSLENSEDAHDIALMALQGNLQ